MVQCSLIEQSHSLTSGNPEGLYDFIKDYMILLVNVCKGITLKLLRIDFKSNEIPS